MKRISLLVIALALLFMDCEGELDEKHSGFMVPKTADEDSSRYPIVVSKTILHADPFGKTNGYPILWGCLFNGLLQQNFHALCLSII